MGRTETGWRSFRASCAPHPQDLFFHYVFNNFLHTHVEVCVSTLRSSDTPIQNPVVKHVSWASRSPFGPWG